MSDYVECRECGYVAEISMFTGPDNEVCPKCFIGNWGTVDEDELDMDEPGDD